MAADSSPECREAGCESLATTGGYCRGHYIKNWAAIKQREELLKDGRLEMYLGELVRKYPEPVIRDLRQDLSSDEEFERVVRDLGLHESDADLADVDGGAVDDSFPFGSVSAEDFEGGEGEAA